MSEQAIYRAESEGKTMLIGGGDYVTMKVRSDETSRAYFAFEARTTPGFGPPLHRHAYRELFYVLEGEYEFTVEREGRLETFTAGPGSVLAVPPNQPHTFRNGTDAMSRLLMVHTPAALEEFFEEYGVEVSKVGERPEGLEPPDPTAMAGILPRHGVELVGAPAGI